MCSSRDVLLTLWQDFMIEPHENLILSQRKVMLEGKISQLKIIICTYLIVLKN